jgi:hypothetical protein
MSGIDHKEYTVSMTHEFVDLQTEERSLLTQQCLLLTRKLPLCYCLWISAQQPKSANLYHISIVASCRRHGHSAMSGDRMSRPGHEGVGYHPDCYC